MVSREELIGSLGGLLRDAGFEGRNRHFILAGPELDWLLQLELIPRTTRVGIYVGVSPRVLASGTEPTRANDCPIVFDPESGGEPFGLDHWQVWRALDVESDVPDDVRAETLAETVRAVSLVARRVSTLAALRQMAADGQIREFVRKDARSLIFETGESPHLR